MENHGGPMLRRVHFYVFVLCLSFGISVFALLLPDIAVSFFARGPHHCDDRTSKPCRAAQGTAGLALGIAGWVRSSCSMFLGPLVCTLSDAHGRYAFFLAAMVLSFLAHLALSGHVFGLFSLWPYFGLQALGGVCMPIVLSMVADETAPQARAAAFGKLLAAFQVSMVLVPPVVKVMDLRGAALAGTMSIAASTILGAAYGETLPPSQRMCFSRTGAPEWRPDKAIRLLASTPLFRRLSVTVAGNSMAAAGVEQCFLLFLESSYGLQRADAGMLIAFTAVSSLGVQATILPLLIRRLIITKILMLGLACQVLQNSVLLVCHSVPALAVACVLSGFGDLTFPCVCALKANAAPESMVGRVQGAVGALQSLARGLGHLIYGGLFNLLLRPHYPRGPFPQGIFLMSILVLSPLVMLTAGLHWHLPPNLTQFQPQAVLRRRVSAAELGTTLSESELVIPFPTSDRRVVLF